MPAVFYLFLPHGSRKISDLSMLRYYSQDQILTAPRVICHDQEPLNYQYYSDDSAEMQHLTQQINQQFKNGCGVSKWLQLSNNNLKLGTYSMAGIDIHDNAVLLHSELNSADLELYESNGYIGAYWWSHGLIARDWYRYAQVDPMLQIERSPTIPFLIYSRGFTREREYRLKFIELLVQNNLHLSSQISMLHMEDGKEVQQYVPLDQQFQVKDLSVFDKIVECKVSGSASAVYNTDEIINSFVNVVLETQYNGSKMHLTEKILRPIACGQPFILAAAPGALSLLRYYGFTTYEGLIDESYDLETDSVKRLEKIVLSMQKLQSQSKQEWNTWWNQAQHIAKLNQTHFFSEEFFTRVVTQLKFNLSNALYQAETTRGKFWRNNRKQLRITKPNNWKAALNLPNERLKAGKLFSLCR